MRTHGRAGTTSLEEVTTHIKFINSFQSILMDTNQRETNKQERLVIAIEELDDSAEFVATLREELDGMKPILERKNKKADQMMKEAKNQRKELTKQVEAVKYEENVVEKTILEIKLLEQNCKEALALAMPPLEKAVKVIKSLKKSDLDEVKSMKKPPNKVKITLEVICLMLGLEPKQVSDPNDLSIKYLGKKDNFFLAFFYYFFYIFSTLTFFSCLHFCCLY